MKIDVLNSGRVELVDRMGDDYSILRAARVSTGSEVSKGYKKDRGLIRYLYRNNHISPFAFVSFQFYFKMPIFVARQFFRHRTFDVNEASARYKEFEWEVFYPDSWREQDTTNKQSSIGEINHQELISEMVKGICKKTNLAYTSMLEHNVAREQARTVMPVGQYTEFYASINLRNLFHFLELRLHPHAQYEIKVYAEAVLEILESLEDLKWSVEIFKEMNELNYMYQELLNEHKLDLNSLKQKLFRMLNQDKYE